MQKLSRCTLLKGTVANLLTLSARSSCIEHFVYGPAGIVHVCLRQRRMNEKHQTRFSQLFGYLQTFRRTKFRSESFFEIDFAAASCETRYPLGHNCRENPVSRPSWPQQF